MQSQRIMELELDLSVTGAAANLTFASAETEAVFVLLGHLPGFVQEKIEVSVNEAGTEISISGEGDKSSLETVIGRRLRLKNELRTSPFRKVFRIPNGVALDKIDASFYEDEAILMILMPKSVKCEVSGTVIEEVEEGRIEGDEVIPFDRPREVEAEIEDAGKPKEEQEVEQGNEEASLRREETEEKLDQNEIQRSGLDRNGEGEAEHEEKNIDSPDEKEEVPGELPDRPQTPSTKIEEPDLEAEPPPPEESEPINGAEQIDQIEEASNRPHQQMEEEEEDAAATESDRDLHQPEELRPHPEDQVHEQEQQENREQQVPEPFEAPKSDGDLRHPEQSTNTGEASDQVPHGSGDNVEEATNNQPAAETDKPIEEDDEEASSPDEEGERRRGSGSKGKRSRKKGGRGGPPPSLVVSAFLLSLVAFVARLVRNRRRR